MIGGVNETCELTNTVYVSDYGGGIRIRMCEHFYFTTLWCDGHSRCRRSGRHAGRSRVVPLGSSGGLIRISVFATSREDAAEACNRIAKKYIAGSFGKARLIDGAR